MIITVWGKAWSGKWTCINLLQQNVYNLYGITYEIISVGDIKRALAEEMKLSIQEFNLLGERPENILSFDNKYEEMQKKLDPESNILLDSRLSYRCQPSAFKLFLDVDDLEWARRINSANRNTDDHWSLEETIRINQERNRLDAERYLRLYNTNPRDTSNYDLVVDTTTRTPQEIVNIILSELQRKDILSN